MLRDLGYFAREALRRPPGFLLWRARQALARRVRTAHHALGGRPYAPSFGARPRRRSVLDTPAIDRALVLLERHAPGELSAVVERAERVASGEVTVLSRSVRVATPVDWFVDPVSGHRWPPRFHARYRYADLIRLDEPSDVKMPWELSRLQFLPVLALAARITGEARYGEAAVRLTADWMTANPVGVGVNWTIGMEAALRAISLLVTAELLDRELPVDLERALGEHGRFLFRNIERSDVNGNHHTACLLGLLYLGVGLPDEAESSAWRDAALTGLGDAVTEQVYEDGVCHEGSIPYHRLVAEMFLHAVALCRRSGLTLPPGSLERVAAMLEFCKAYTKPGGEAPVWGDNDDGRVHAIGSQRLHDHRYLLAIGSLLFDRGELWPGVAGVSADILPYVDAELVELLESRLANGEPTSPPCAAAYPRAGFFILRADDGYCLVDCGDVGLRGRGGHGHNDALGIEVALAGLDVLVDTGCASYTRSLDHRRLTLTAESHNVAMIDGLEPAPLRFERLPHASACPVEPLAWDELGRAFEGAHHGYSGGGEIGAFRRRVELLTGRHLVIEDEVEGTGEHLVVWRFHLAAAWRIASEAADVIDAVHEAGWRLSLRCEPETLCLEVDEHTGFPAYDVTEGRLRISTRRRGPLPYRARFELRVEPRVDTAGSPDAQEAAVAGRSEGLS